MTYRGHVKNGQIMLDESVSLSEGVRVNIEVPEQAAQITRPQTRVKLRSLEPLEMPGDSLADELVDDRR